MSTSKVASSTVAESRGTADAKDRLTQPESQIDEKSSKDDAKGKRDRKANSASDREVSSNQSGAKSTDLDLDSSPQSDNNRDDKILALQTQIQELQEFIQKQLQSQPSSASSDRELFVPSDSDLDPESSDFDRDRDHYDARRRSRSRSLDQISKVLQSMVNHAKTSQLIWPIPKHQAHGRSRSTSTFFFQRFERCMNIYKSHRDLWTRVLPSCMGDDWSQSWVHENITEKNISWEAAQTAFANYFDKVDDFSELFHEFENLHQAESESVQQFATVFKSLLNQLEGLSTEKYKSHAFIAKLNAKTRAVVMSHLSTPKDRLALESFEETLDLCNHVGRPEVLASMGLGNTSYSRSIPSGDRFKRRASTDLSNSTHQEKRAKSGSGPNDVCHLHPSSVNQHTNAQCYGQNPDIARPPRRNPLPSHSHSHSQSRSHVPAREISNPTRTVTPNPTKTCHNCGKTGHFSHQCYAKRTNSDSSKPLSAAAAPASILKKEFQSTDEKRVRFENVKSKNGKQQ